MAFSESKVKVPHYIRHNQTVGAGLSSWVHRLNAVAKCYTSSDNSAREREIAVYKRLGSGDWHPGILRFYGVLDAQCVVLQFAEHGTVRQYMSQGQGQNKTRQFTCRHIPLTVKMRWIEQTVDAIAFIHSHNVYHCDISSNNIFLDENLNAMVGDFSGSSMDGAECLSWYETSHSHPDMMDPSPQSEIFALGSTMYEIIQGKRPFEGMEDMDIQESFRKGRWPDLQLLPLEDIIAKCWRQEYDSVEKLSQDIKSCAQDQHEIRQETTEK